MVERADLALFRRIQAHVGAGRWEIVNGWWVQLKAQERKQRTGDEGSVLDGVPREAPALLRAERLTEKASRVHFDWSKVEDVRAKVDEELGELDEAIRGGDRVRIQDELGDVLFALANLGRWLHAPPEDALRGTIGRFVERFHYIEAKLRERGRPPSDSTLEELDGLWNEAKAVGFTIKSDGAFHTYRVNLTGNAQWAGTIAQIRFDPPNGPSGQDFAIDWIRLTD